MIGSFPLPTFSNSHHHGAGFHGSPDEAKARRELKSCRSNGFFFASLRLCGESSVEPDVATGSLELLMCELLTSSSQAASARTSVGDIPSTSTLCFAQNSHIRSGVG